MMTWGTSSRLVHRTLPPTGTDAAAGAKLKLSTATSLRAATVVSASSGRSVIAIGESIVRNDMLESPSTFRNRSSDTFIGPGEGAVPGAGCRKAVDMAV